MRFLKEGSDNASNYREAIEFMEAEMENNSRTREKMQKLLIVALILIMFSLAGFLFRHYLEGSIGLMLNLALIRYSFIKWRKARMYLCFSAYSCDRLKKEYRDLYKVDYP